jgi:hypothetical protein
MKKLFAIVVIAMFGFAFGCGATPPAVETPEAPAVETPEVPETDVVPEVPEAPAEEAPAEATE